MRLRTLYFRNLLKDILDHWLVCLLIILCCGAGLAAFGYTRADSMQEQKAENAEKIANFNKRVAKYDADIADVESAIEKENESITNLQAYIDGSIYMQIDGSAVKVSGAKYTINVAEGTSLDLTGKALVQYITGGEMLSEVADGYTELNPAAWKEIISAKADSNLFTVTVLHYDEAAAAEIRGIVCEKLQAAAGRIAESQGAFTLDDETLFDYTNNDGSLTSAQNTTRTSLRSATNARADLEAKYVTQNTNRDKYIENNTPEELSYPGRKENTIRFGIFGLIGGAALAIAIFAIRYILSDKIRRKEELDGSGLPVLAVIRQKELYPGAERLSMELAEISRNDGCKGVFLQDLGKTDQGEILKPVFADFEDNYAYGSTEGDDLEELRAMHSLGSAVLLLETGQTRFRQIEKQVDLCSRFGIKLLGCILAE